MGFSFSATTTSCVFLGSFHFSFPTDCPPASTPFEKSWKLTIRGVCKTTFLVEAPKRPLPCRGKLSVPSLQDIFTPGVANPLSRQPPPPPRPPKLRNRATAEAGGESSVWAHGLVLCNASPVLKAALGSLRLARGALRLGGKTHTKRHRAAGGRANRKGTHKNTVEVPRFFSAKGTGGIFPNQFNQEKEPRHGNAMKTNNQATRKNWDSSQPVSGSLFRPLCCFLWWGEPFQHQHGSLKYTCCNHLKHSCFHQNKGKPQFTRQCSGV